MTLKNNRASLLCYFKQPLVNSNCSFSPKTPNLGQNGIFFSSVTLQFDRWPWKTIGHILHATSSFVHNCVCVCVYSNWKYCPETPNLGQITRFLEPCDLEIWRMTLKNNRASLPCYFKLCATFRSHCWIHTGVTVRKRPIWVKLHNF